MRYGDLESLKRILISRFSEDDSRIREIITEEIDNAPEVDLDERDMDVFETGYIRGWCVAMREAGHDI